MMLDSNVIGEGKLLNGKGRQDITINYRFIGNLLEHAKEDICSAPSCQDLK